MVLNQTDAEKVLTDPTDVCLRLCVGSKSAPYPPRRVCPGSAQDGLQFLLRPGAGAGPGGAEEGAAGLRPLEQDGGLLPRVQRAGRSHPGGY